MGAIGERNVSVTRSATERPPPPQQEDSHRPRRDLCRAVLMQGSGQQLTPVAARQVLKAAKADASLARVSRQNARAMAAEERRIDRRFRRWLRNLHRRDHRFWVRVRTPRSQRIPMARRTEKRDTRNRCSLPAYRAPILDKLGRRGIFLSFEYDGARRNSFGVFRRRAEYSLQSDGVRQDLLGRPIYVSNMGRTPEEICEAADALEGIMRAERANAKLSVNAILQLPYDASVEQQLEIVRRFCSQVFEAHDLPYVAVLHKADEAGDQRNVHAHITFAFRPMVRVGDHRWAVSTDLRTDLDGPDQFYEYRRRAAAIMTTVMRKAGHRHTYTHLSNAERGLAIIPQKKLGKAKASQVRREQFVGDNAFNVREVTAGERVLQQLHTARPEQLTPGSRPQTTTQLSVSRRPAASRILPVRPTRQVGTQAPARRRLVDQLTPVAVDTGRVARIVGPQPSARHALIVSRKPRIEPALAARTSPVRVPLLRTSSPLALPIVLKLAMPMPQSRASLIPSLTQSKHQPIDPARPARIGRVTTQPLRPTALLIRSRTISGSLQEFERQPWVTAHQAPSRLANLGAPKPISMLPIEQGLTALVDRLRHPTSRRITIVRVPEAIPLARSTGQEQRTTLPAAGRATTYGLLPAAARHAPAQKPIAPVTRRDIRPLPVLALPRITRSIQQGLPVLLTPSIRMEERPRMVLALPTRAAPGKERALEEVSRPAAIALVAPWTGGGAITKLRQATVSKHWGPSPWPAVTAMPPLSPKPQLARTVSPSSKWTIIPLPRRAPFVQQLCSPETSKAPVIGPVAERRKIGDDRGIAQLLLARDALMRWLDSLREEEAARLKALRMSSNKEKAIDAASEETLPVDGDELVRRLRSGRVYLVQEDGGHVLPHDRRRFSDAELAWMQAHQLDLLGVQRDQQELIEQLATYVDEHMDSFRTGTLKVDKEFAAAWDAFAAAPAIRSVIWKAEQDAAAPSGVADVQDRQFAEDHAGRDDHVGSRTTPSSDKVQPDRTSSVAARRQAAAAAADRGR